MIGKKFSMKTLINFFPQIPFQFSFKSSNFFFSQSCDFPEMKNKWQNLLTIRNASDSPITRKDAFEIQILFLKNPTNYRLNNKNLSSTNFRKKCF